MFLLFLQLFSDGAKFQLMIICYKVERTGNHALGCRRAFSSDLHVSQGIVGLMKQSDFIVIHQLILVWMVLAACKVHSKHQVLFWIIVSFPEGWIFLFFIFLGVQILYNMVKKDTNLNSLLEMNTGICYWKTRILKYWK